MANSSLHENAPHVSVVEARQGNRTRHMMTVLIVSVVLGCVALAVAWGLRAGDFHRADASAASRIAASSPAVTSTTQSPAAATPQNPATTGLNR